MFDGGVRQLGPVARKTSGDKTCGVEITHSSCRSEVRHSTASMESVVGLHVCVSSQMSNVVIKKKKIKQVEKDFTRGQRHTKQWPEISPLTAQL